MLTTSQTEKINKCSLCITVCVCVWGRCHVCVYVCVVYQGMRTARSARSDSVYTFPMLTNPGADAYI